VAAARLVGGLVMSWVVVALWTSHDAESTLGLQPGVSATARESSLHASYGADQPHFDRPPHGPDTPQPYPSGTRVIVS
jgi:hypothetical protein